MRAPAPDSARPGVPFSPSDPHYTWLWTAQYDDLDTGPWLPQLDDLGRARSPGMLDFERLVRLKFMPQRPDRYPIEIRAQKVLGEQIRHFWTVDHPVDGSPPHVAFAIVLERPAEGIATYCFLNEDGSLNIGSRANW